MNKLRYCKKHHLGPFAQNFMFLRTVFDENFSYEYCDRMTDEILDQFDLYCEQYLPTIKVSVLRHCFNNNVDYDYENLLNDFHNGMRLTNGTDVGGVCLGLSENVLSLGYCSNNMIINEDTMDFHIEKLNEYTGMKFECIEYGDAFNE